LFPIIDKTVAIPIFPKFENKGGGNMKLNYVAMVLAFCFVLMIGGIAQAGDNTVTLGMLDSSLKDSEGTKVDAFTVKENQIEFDQPGVAKYDKYFKEVAIVDGTVKELKFVLKQKNDGKLTVLEAKPVIDFGRTSLPELKKKIPSLMDQAKSFKPSDDFTGTKKRKVPAVTKGLTKSTDTLKSASSEIPVIMKELDALAAEQESE
jgi:hypothetical protein